MNGNQFDIIIVGAGLSGSLLGFQMGQKGYAVKVIDRSKCMQSIFRSEKIEQPQAELLKKFGVLDLCRPIAPPIGEIIRFESGKSKVFDTKEQYGIRYKTQSTH